jgi:ABC-type dipeptide/oligopeptide/nickel transport system permease subunit
MVKSVLSQEEILDIDVPVCRVTLALRHGWEAFKHAVSELCRSKTAMVGAFMLLVLLALCLLTPYIARYDPIKQNYREMLQTPSAKHYFGTDRYGRDIWSRILWGGRRLLAISVLAVLVGVLVGIPMGTLSGYYGKAIDAFTMRLVDAWLAFPGILIYLMLATLVREWKLAGFWNDLALIFALGTNQVPRLARLVRGTVLAEKEKEYVEACRAIGDGNLYIALREILPNCVSPVIVQATVSLGSTLLVIAALSFLGLGSPPPTPDWGSDLNLARDHMESRPLIAVFPGLAISYAVLAFNLFGDGLRDILDPRLADK